MATTREIAARIGLSKSTVSLALREDSRISASTREKVRAVAQELGYRPNPVLTQMMRSMRASQPMKARALLGLLHGFSNPRQARTNSYHQDWVKGATQRATQLGYIVDELWLYEPGMSARRLTGVIRARGINALLIAPLPERSQLNLEWEHFSAVAAGQKLVQPRLSRVEPNHMQAILHCLEQLCRHGYRRIGLVLSTELTPAVRFQLKAPVLWLQHQLKVSPLVEPLDPLPLQRKGFEQWLRKQKPEALILSTRQAAVWLESMGWKVPGDIGVACTSLTVAPEGFSGVDQLPQRLGAAATDLLVAQMNRGEFGVPANPKTVLTDVAWRPGTSLREVGPPLDHDLKLVGLL